MVAADSDFANAALPRIVKSIHGAVVRCRI